MVFPACGSASLLINWLWARTVIDPPTESDGHYTVQLLISWLDPSPSPSTPSSDASRLQEMKSRASAFADPIRAAVLSIPPDTPVQEIAVADWPCLPWENFSGRVTLVGDAAHAMTMCIAPSSLFSFSALILLFCFTDIRGGGKKTAAKQQTTVSSTPPSSRARSPKTQTRPPR